VSSDPHDPNRHHDNVDDGDDDATVMGDVSDELLAAAQRSQDLSQPPPAPTPEAPPQVAGLGQMFSRDPTAVRHALPTDEESDALLDSLFDDEEEERKAVARPMPAVADKPADKPAAAASRPMAPPPMPTPAPMPAMPPLMPPRPPRPAPLAQTPLMPFAADDRDREAALESVAPDALESVPPDAPTRPPPPMRAEAAELISTPPEMISDVPEMISDIPEMISAPPATRSAPPEELAPPPPRPAFDDGHAALVDGAKHDDDPNAEPVSASIEDFTAKEDASNLPLPPPRTPVPPPASMRPSSMRPSMPPALPSKPPASASFDHEQEASAHLLRTGARDGWIARAEWLRAEADEATDPTERARALLLVSELYAMAGEEETARALAIEARDLAALPLAQRQARALAAREADLVAVLEALDQEAKAVDWPAARVHALTYGAELARITGDEEGARKRLDLALRMAPEDPRAHARRFAEALAQTESEQGPSALRRVRAPEAPELAALAEAEAHATAHRGLPSLEPRAVETPHEALLLARTAIASGRKNEVISAIDGLGKLGPLAGGSAWLVGVVAAAHADTRPHSLDALKQAANGTHPALAKRAAAARALELGDSASAQAAITSPDGFSAADRVTITALTGGSLTEVSSWAESLLGDPELAPIGGAATAALSDPGDPEREAVPLGDIRARSAAMLGRALAGNEFGAIDRAVRAYSDVAAETGAARALGLELDLESGAGARIAHAVAQGEGDGERERAFAGAIIAEAAGAPDRAALELDRVRQLDLTNEAATRACMAHAEPHDAAKMLSEHAQALESSARAALALTEAGVRLATANDAEESDRLLRRAGEMDSSLPFSSYLGERSARSRGDREALVEWLRSRREASVDPIEQAYDLVREALLVSDDDAAPAAHLLETALRARPNDVGLRELYERLSAEAPPDRAAWRMTQAEGSEGSESARFALEAALDLERAGDLEGASKAAALAIARGEELLAPLVAYRAGLGGHGAGDLIDALMPRARESQDPVEKTEIYERLAELDERGRSDTASGLLWRRTILDEAPGHLPTLCTIETTLIEHNRHDELDGVAVDIARALDGAEAVAHAALAARLRHRSGSWEDAREAIEIAYKQSPRGLWALRAMDAHARAANLWELALAAERQLLERTQRASEAATISLRAAESAIRAGQASDAQALLEHAVTLSPRHLLARLELAEVLEKAGDFVGAASELEAAADVCQAADQRADLLHRAAILWQDHAGDADRARGALERVVETDVSNEDVFQRLKGLYVASGARADLAALLKKRLDAVADPSERVEMEVLRGRALADVGDATAAKHALAAALEASPDHVEALTAFSEVAASEADWSGAEQAWIRLARLVSDSARQAEIYYRLGDLYDDGEKLPNPDRAELSYQEILKRLPADVKARERLVALYLRMGDGARAIEQQTVLINAAEQPEEKCRRTAELAEIYEQAGDAKKAETTLLQARKTWPKDEVALAGLARFYLRTGQGPAAQVLLDRAVADARRALGTGRFEPYLFSTIATVADLRGRPDASRVAKAAVSALDGSDADVAGAGSAAGAMALDDLLAPEVMTPAFRDLLQQTGHMLDQEAPFDLNSVRATPLPPQQAELSDLIRTLGSTYGLHGLQAYVSNALGAVCVPASTNPPVLVLGQALVASPREDVRAFLIHRALKILQTHGSALSRTAPIDLWPLVAAYLKAFNPSWTPQGVDPAKLTEFYGRVSRVVPKPLDPQVPLLAADVIGNIGNRASTLNTVINGWGNRAALLAVGDLNVAIQGIAWAGGHMNAPPANGKDRTTWIGRNAEARELVVFSVSDAYADARARLELGDA
jgi:hypothetical protein